MDEQLASRLGHVQIVLKELVDGEQRLLVQGVDGVLLEHLLQEHLAQGGGQLIDQTADAQVLIVDDVALGVEHLAHLDGDLGLLIGLGQVTQVDGHGADAHEDPALAVQAQGLLDGGGHLFHIPGGGGVVHLVDEGHVLLAHGQNEIVLPVGEQVLHQLQGHRLQPVVHRADDEHGPLHLGGHMQLLGPHVNVADEDIIGDDVLDEGALVVLLLIVILGAVEGHGSHGADGVADAVVAAGENGVVEMAAPAGQGLEGLALQRNAIALRRGDGLDIFAPLGADGRQLAAGDDGALRVHDADGAIGGLLKLQNHVLKNSTRHDGILPSVIPAGLCAICCVSSRIISSLSRICKVFFIFSTNFCPCFLLVCRYYHNPTAE